MPPAVYRLGPRISLTMRRRDYRPWSQEEEDNLEEWVAKHLSLTWDERAEIYSDTICPRSSESLRSKLRQVKRNIRRRRALHTRHLQGRRGMMATAVRGRQRTAVVPSRSCPCPRYAASRQTGAGLQDPRFTTSCPTYRRRFSTLDQTVSSLPDKTQEVKPPVAYNRIDLAPQSKRGTPRITSHIPEVMLTIHLLL